jgi:hypothetical protein
MTLQTLLEEDRERLIQALGAGDAAEAVRVLEGELDRILYTFNDREECAPVREAASAMLRTARAAGALVDCAGETKIYGRTEYGAGKPGGRKLSRPGLILLILGLAAAGTGAAWALLSAAAGQSAGLPPRYILAGVPLLVFAASFLAGLTLKKRRAAPKETLHAETKPDARRIYTRLLAVILVIDRQLEEVRGSAGQAEREKLREQVSAMDPAELELLSGLLEDAYARRGEDGQAEEEISRIRFYLHRKGVETVDWDPDAAEQSAWFDRMPAYAAGTLRPALTADGALLKKGLASAGRG